MELDRYCNAECFEKEINETIVTAAQQHGFRRELGPHKKGLAAGDFTDDSSNAPGL
jgi:hypothetical protein